jgi:transposase InsO family protein
MLPEFELPADSQTVNQGAQFDRAPRLSDEKTGHPEGIAEDSRILQYEHFEKTENPPVLFKVTDAIRLTGIAKQNIHKAISTGKLQALLTETTEGHRKGRFDWRIPAASLFTAYPQARDAWERRQRAVAEHQATLKARHEAAVARRQAALEARRAKRGTPPPRETYRAVARGFLLDRLAQYVEREDCSAKLATALYAQAYNDKALPSEEIPDWVRKEVPEVSARSLERWRSDLKAFGLAGLEDRYGNRAGSGLLDQNQEQRNALLGLFLDKPHITTRRLAEAMQVRFGEGAPSYFQIRMFLKTWKAEHKGELELATNPDAWKSHRQVAFGNRAETVAERLNQLWELDATKADLILNGYRYVLCTVIDVFSRRTMFLLSDSPRGTAHAELMRRAIAAWGLPETIRTDNGKDYTSAYMARVVRELGIQQVLCQPFSGEQKPFVERVQGTFNHDLVPLLEGFTGHNVAQAQSLRARKTFAQRLFKEGTVELGITPEAFEKFIEDWTLAYEHRTHDGLKGRTPAQVVSEWTSEQPVRRVRDLNALTYLLAEGAFKTIQKKGIRHENRYYVAAELAAHVGERVEIRLSPEDAGRVAVFQGGAFLCLAEDPELTGTSRQEIAAMAHAAQKAHKKALKVVHRSLKSALKPANLVQEILAHRHAAIDPVESLQRAVFVDTDALAASAAAKAMEDGLVLKAPAVARRLSVEEEAEVEQTLERMQPKPAAVPELDRNGRPSFFRDDAEWGKWVMANPDKATEGDLEEFGHRIKHEWAFRELMGLNKAAV